MKFIDENGNGEKRKLEEKDERYKSKNEEYRITNEDYGIKKDKYSNNNET